MHACAHSRTDADRSAGEVFSQQIAMSSEARAKAAARAAELGTQLGFTREAAIGFFRIVCGQDVP
jgi:hypothetical protein